MKFDLNAFSAENLERCLSPGGFNHPLDGWSLSDWMVAATGELGEAANVLKKLNRVRDGIPGNTETPEHLRAQFADEIADTVIYLDLLAQAAGFTLAQAVRTKFNKTSAKIGYSRPSVADRLTQKPGGFIEHIARICHEVNRAYCASQGDNSQVPWHEAPDWQKNSAIAGVQFILKNPDAGPERSHESWLEEKRRDGWTYRPIKDAAAKQHPCFVPYQELPAAQKAKNYIFGAIVRALAP